jgi:hypothetical protein
MGGALTELRASDAVLFGEAIADQLAALDLDGDARALLARRAEAAFRSTLRERDGAYDVLSEVFTASLALHDFLLQSEGDILYEPAASGVSRDPVLEAVPRTEELGEELWAGVDRITRALESMDALPERVTTARLFSLLFEQLEQTSVP